MSTTIHSPHVMPRRRWPRWLKKVWCFVVGHDVKIVTMTGPRGVAQSARACYRCGPMDFATFELLK